jgi:hypothetical protein
MGCTEHVYKFKFINFTTSQCAKMCIRVHHDETKNETWDPHDPTKTEEQKKQAMIDWQTQDFEQRHKIYEEIKKLGVFTDYLHGQYELLKKTKSEKSKIINLNHSSMTSQQPQQSLKLACVWRELECCLCYTAGIKTHAYKKSHGHPENYVNLQFDWDGAKLHLRCNCGSIHEKSATGEVTATHSLNIEPAKMEGGGNMHRHTFVNNNGMGDDYDYNNEGEEISKGDYKYIKYKNKYLKVRKH